MIRYVCRKERILKCVFVVLGVRVLSPGFDTRDGAKRRIFSLFPFLSIKALTVSTKSEKSGQLVGVEGRKPTSEPVRGDNSISECDTTKTDHMHMLGVSSQSR